MNWKDQSPRCPTFPVDLSDSALYRRRKSQEKLENSRDTFNFDDYSEINSNTNVKIVQNTGYCNYFCCYILIY